MVLHPIYQQLLEVGYDPLDLSAATERMLLHPIYKLLLEGGYDPVVLSAATERMLLHPIYQLLLEGGYDPLLKGCFYTLFTIYYWNEAMTPWFINYY